MDREKALGIMGLKSDATRDDIEKRMRVLSKKFQHIEKDKNGSSLADIDAAYKFLIGIEYHNTADEQKRKYQKEHPNPIIKLLGLDQEKVSNFFFYYKWHLIIGIAAIVLIVSTIVSIVNRVEPNLQVIIGGDILVPDTETVEERIRNEVPGATEPIVQNIYLSENSDPQMQVGMQTKFVVEMAAGENDLYILDEEKYLELAKQGAFLDVTDVLGDLTGLGIKTEDHERLKVAVEAGDDDIKYEPELYGLNVSDSRILKDLGLTGDRYIVSFGHNGKNRENAMALVKALLK